MKHQVNYLPTPIYKLSKKDMVIYKYVESYQKEIFALSQKELASNVGLSEATVSRFVQKLGFKNYKTFVIKVNHEIKTSSNEFFSLDKKNHNAIADIITSYQFAFEKNINYDIIKRCEELAINIMKMKRVIVFGLGSSLSMSRELTANIQRLGIYSITPRDFHSLLPLMGDPREDEMYIIISNNLENREIQFMIKKVINNANLSVITSNKTKALELGISFENIIGFSKIHNEENQVSFSSKNAINLINDLIFLFLLEKSTKKNKIRFRNGMNLIEEWKKFKY